MQRRETALLFVMVALTLGINATFAEGVENLAEKELKNTSRNHAFDALKDAATDLSKHTVETACENPGSSWCQTARLSGLALTIIIAVAGIMASLALMKAVFSHLNA